MCVCYILYIYIYVLYYAILYVCSPCVFTQKVTLTSGGATCLVHVFFKTDT